MILERKSDIFYCQLLFIAVGIFFSILANGQDVCSQNLEEARRQFDEGRFYNIELIIAECLDNGFTKQERIDALELLALTKLYLDEMDKADSIYLDLLRQDPEHQVNELVDPPDLMFLHNNFRTKPVFYWSVIAGLNYSSPSIIHDYSPFSFETTNEQYKAKLGYEGGVSIEFNVYKDLYFGGELLYSRKNFLFTDDPEFYSETVSNEYNISYIEANHFFSIPLIAKYTFGEKRIRPYFYGGLSLDLLLFSNQNDLSKLSPIDEENEDLASLNISNLRNPWNFSGIIGIGARIKTDGISLIALDFKVVPGFTNITKESRRYIGGGEVQGQNVIISGAVSDAMRLNCISLSIRYVSPFYNPKLKKDK